MPRSRGFSYGIHDALIYPAYTTSLRAPATSKKSPRMTTGERHDTCTGTRMSLSRGRYSRVPANIVQRQIHGRGTCHNVRHVPRVHANTIVRKRERETPPVSVIRSRPYKFRRKLSALAVPVHRPTIIIVIIIIPIIVHRVSLRLMPAAILGILFRRI